MKPGSGSKGWFQGLGEGLGRVKVKRECAALSSRSVQPDSQTDSDKTDRCLDFVARRQYLGISGPVNIWVCFCLSIPGTTRGPWLLDT